MTEEGLKMGRINVKKKTHREKSAHVNFMGGPSYDISNPLSRLGMAASSCFFGEPMYYHRDKDDKRKVRRNPPGRLDDGLVDHLRETLDAIDPREWRSMTPAELMEDSIDAALDHDVEATLAFAVELRNVGNIRTTPQVILVRAAMHPSVKGTNLIAKHAPNIIRRADEPSVGLAYFIWRYGADGKRGKIPSRLKRAWQRALEGFDEYSLSKYRMESRAVKTVDVVNLVHPKSDVIDKLVKGELKTTGETWEAVISEKGSNAEAWREILPKMGHMALLRNLRNLLKVGLEPKEFISKLIEGAPKGRQLPFRYYSAYRAVEKDAPAAVLDGIEECLLDSIGNLPQFEGRTMSLCDNSGSAHGAFTSSLGTMTVASIGNLTGVLTGMASEDGHVGIFGDRLKTFATRKRSSVIDQLKKADKIGQGIGGGTEHGIWLFWDKAIKEQEHWDHVFVYSDMQAGHGGLFGKSVPRNAIFEPKGGSYIDVPKLISRYRREVNPDVLVFLVQTAGYQDTIVPEFYDKTYILGGWSQSVIQFAGEMTTMVLGGAAHTAQVPQQ
jgi:hypothetical protein